MNDRPARGPRCAPPQVVTFDAIMPTTMAARAEESGVQRVRIDPLTTFTLSVLAGAFISFGAIFATTVSAGNIAVVGRRRGGVHRRAALWRHASPDRARVLAWA